MNTALLRAIAGMPNSTAVVIDDSRIFHRPYSTCEIGKWVDARIVDALAGSCTMCPHCWSVTR